MSDHDEGTQLPFGRVEAGMNSFRPAAFSRNPADASRLIDHLTMAKPRYATPSRRADYFTRFLMAYAALHGVRSQSVTFVRWDRETDRIRRRGVGSTDRTARCLSQRKA